MIVGHLVLKFRCGEFERLSRRVEFELVQLAANGILAFTLWRFGEPSLWQRFRSRAIEWSDYNRSAPRPLDLSQLEAGDHLLRWGDSNGPKRYCHYSDETERDALLQTLPLETIDHYTEDGRSKDLNEYLVLRRSP